MSRSLFFTLGIALAGSISPARAEQFGPRPEQIETERSQIETPPVPPVHLALRAGADEAESELDDADDGDPDGGEPTAEENEAAGKSADEQGDEETAEEKNEDGAAEKSGNESDGDDADPPPADHKDDADALELELNTSAGTRGEGAVDALFHLHRGSFSGALGVGNGGGDQAAQRQWLRAQVGVDPGVAISAAGLLQPEQQGSSQEQLQLSAAQESANGSWELSLLQQDARLTPAAAGLSAHSAGMELAGYSGAIDAARLIGDGVSATAHAGGGIFLLSLPKSVALPWSALAPWDRLGQKALAWPARAEGALGLLLEGSIGTASASLGAGLPAESGALEAALTIAGERKFGRATVSLQLSAAHLWPNDLWQGALTFGARWRFAQGFSQPDRT